MSGTLFGVGVGPGDPELVTRKAWQHIQAATHVVYPVPAHLETSRARTTVADAIQADCVEIPYALPMRAERQPAQQAYDALCAQLFPLLQAGHTVSVLCEGDPSFYGSFLYVRARLQDYPCQIIPGISSVMAGAAVAHVPLAVREEMFGALPATLDVDVLRARLRVLDSVVFMKAGRYIPKLKEVLAGWQSVYIENISHLHQRMCALEEAPEAGPYFSVVFARKGNDPWI